MKPKSPSRSPTSRGGSSPRSNVPPHILLSLILCTAMWVSGLYMILATHPHLLNDATTQARAASMISKDDYAGSTQKLQQLWRKLEDHLHLHPPQNNNNNKQHVKNGLQQSIFAFTIRDAKRLVPTDIVPGMHLYDYVDIYHQSQMRGDAHLFLDGIYIDQEPPCQEYSLECYRDKLVQVFHHLINTTNYEYYFYMESDNVLCVPLEEIEALAFRHQRYFIGTGIGASGWIMRRDFLVDFLLEYAKLRNEALATGKHNNIRLAAMPDMVASGMMMENRTWSVTSRYLVSHTILPSMGATALTTPGASANNNNGQGDDDAHAPRRNNNQRPKKHLPRCLEPHRGVWGDKEEDSYGWDFFDHAKCHGQEIYPCDTNTTDIPFPPRPPPREARRVFQNEDRTRELQDRCRSMFEQERDGSDAKDRQKAKKDHQAYSDCMKEGMARLRNQTTVVNNPNQEHRNDHTPELRDLQHQCRDKFEHGEAYADCVREGIALLRNNLTRVVYNNPNNGQTNPNNAGALEKDKIGKEKHKEELKNAGQGQQH